MVIPMPHGFHPSPPSAQEDCTMRLPSLVPKPEVPHWVAFPYQFCPSKDVSPGGRRTSLRRAPGASSHPARNHTRRSRLQPTRRTTEHPEVVVMIPISPASNPSPPAVQKGCTLQMQLLCNITDETTRLASIPPQRVFCRGIPGSATCPSLASSDDSSTTRVYSIKLHLPISLRTRPHRLSPNL